MILFPRYCSEHGKLRSGGAQFCPICGKETCKRSLRLPRCSRAIFRVIVGLSLTALILFAICYPTARYYRRMHEAEARMHNPWLQLHMLIRAAPASDQLSVATAYVTGSKDQFEHAPPITKEELDWITWDVGGNEEGDILKLIAPYIRNK